jgi:TonB family protein
MIKNIVLSMVGLIILQSCHVSKLSQFKGKYAEFMDAGEQEISTEYHTLLSKKPDGSFIFRQFFPETRQITQKISLSADKKTKNGIYQEWFDDGTLILQGYYKDDMRVGQWNVKDKGMGMYKNGAMEGEWQNKSDEGKLLSAYLYVNGIKDGPFMVYDSLGKISNEGMYRSDTIFSQTKKFTKNTENIKEELPFLSSCLDANISERKACSDKAFLTYMYKNLRYPAIAREYGVQGQALVSFVINKDGKPEQILIKRGLCQAIQTELVSLLKKMPSWEPGKQGGKPVKVVYTVPIVFKLE